MTPSKSLSTFSLASSLCMATITAFALANSPFGIKTYSPLRSTSHSQHNTQFPMHSLSMVQRRGRPRGPVRTMKPLMNTEIKYEKLRVTAPALEGHKKEEQLGIMSKSHALAKAQELGNLDLILINVHSDPPVAKIANYSKFRYEKEKKAKELKRKSKSTEIKEMKMSYKIDIHDYDVRIKNASKFLSKGNRVKFTVQFNGREIQHNIRGFVLLNRMADDLVKISIMEGKPRRDGRKLSCILSPRPGVIKVANDKKRAEDKAKKKQKMKAYIAAAKSHTTPGPGTVVAVTGSAVDETKDEAVGSIRKEKG